MKKTHLNHLVIFFIISSVLIFFGSCKKRCKDCLVITPKIQYIMPIVNKDGEQGWWVKNIEGPERERFLKMLYAGVAAGKLKTYDYTTWTEQTIDNALTLLKGSSNIETTLNRINRLAFFEKWTINKTTSEISKKVIAVCPFALKDTTEIPLFWIKFDTLRQQEVANSVSNLISKRIQYDVPIINNSNNADWWIGNIEASKRSRLINIIFNVAYSGKSLLYDYFNEPVKAEDLRKELNRVDTFTTATPDRSKDTTYIVKKMIDSTAFKKLRFMEEWYFDEQTCNFTKKVKGINLLEEMFSPNGEFLGNKPLFWIYFDKKYPIRN